MHATEAALSSGALLKQTAVPAGGGVHSITLVPLRLSINSVRLIPVRTAGRCDRE